MRQFQRDSDAALHVARTQAEQSISVDAVWQISGSRNRVQMPGDDHLDRGRLGLRDDRIPRTLDAEMSASAECCLDHIGDLPLVVRLAWYIHERGGDIDNIGREVEFGGHADTVAV